jgi:hypothetical protein
MINKYLIPIFIIILILILYNKQYYIPKIAWSYWDKEAPPVVTTIIEERRKIMPDWTIRLLTEADIGEYIDMNSTPAGFDALGNAHKADWIRLKLLEKYGGLWLDSTIIVNNGEAINEIYNEALTRRADFIAFTLNKPRAVDYIENWFIMAPKGCRIMQRLLEEFEKAIRMGFNNYRANILISNPHISDSIYSRKNVRDIYLTQHACIQVVLKGQSPVQSGLLYRPILKQVSTKVLLYPAERNMYRIHTECDWNHKCIIDNVSNNPDVKKIPFIKLRGGEKVIDYKKYFGK